MSEAQERLRGFAALVSGVEHGPRLHLGTAHGPGWWSYRDALAQVAPWHAHLIADTGDRRAAAMSLAGWLAEVPTLVIGLPAVLADVGVDVDLDGLAVRRHTEGWFDGHTLEPTDVRERDDLLAWSGRRIAALTGPVVEQLAHDLPVGRVALWGAVADALSGSALWLAGALGSDRQDAWDRSRLVLDAVETAAQDLHHRARPYPVTFSGGTSLHQVRGTCCLHYRTQTDPDPDGDGYCVTCPLRTDTSRTGRLRAHLERASA